MIYYNLSVIIVTSLNHFAIRVSNKYKKLMKVEAIISEFRLLVSVLSLWVMLSHGGPRWSSLLLRKSNGKLRGLLLL